MPVEFVCVDCQGQVFDAGTNTVPDPPVCHTCQWISTIAEADREAVRAHLRPEAIMERLKHLLPPCPVCGKA